jgi:hypothetical protein
MTGMMLTLALVIQVILDSLVQSVEIFVVFTSDVLWKIVDLSLPWDT